jgi:uncharacterized membrane protein
MTAAASLYDWLLFLHVVAAMIWVGGAVLLGALVTRVLHDREPSAVARFVDNLRVVGPAVLAPATLAVAGLGTWLVLNSGAWSFGQLWVRLAVALFAAAFLIGAVHQSRAAIAAERASERGDLEDALRQLARWSWGYRLIVVLLAVVTWDMVFKPGL